MGFIKTAEAKVMHPRVSQKTWGRVRRTAHQRIATSDLVARASKLLDRSLSPDNYLLTHSTIVCSVDTEKVENAKLGRVKVGGRTIERRYDDYRIVPQCDKYINNNYDAWSRPVILASYPTFIGAHNFLEHLQVESLSKGRVIDAVHRDIGDSVYVDILVATDRKHRELVASIESGELNTLSMGCSIEFSICTKCGNVAEDEVQLCDHVKYEKGNVFYDERGIQRRVAELCGHHTIQPNGGVGFIDASWVAVPAFRGAVLNKILTPTTGVSEQMRRVLAEPSKPIDSRRLQKAARQVIQRKLIAFNGFDEEEEGGDEEGEKAKEEPKSPLKELEEDILNAVVERVKDRVDEDLKGQVAERAVGLDVPTNSTNDNLIKQAKRKGASREQYARGLHQVLQTSTSNFEFVHKLRYLNRLAGAFIPDELYQASLEAGVSSPFVSDQDFLNHCAKVLGRDPDADEAKALVRLGRLLNKFQVRIANQA